MDMLKQYLSLLKRENFLHYRDKINQENRMGLDLIVVATVVFLAINWLLRFAVGRELVHQGTLVLEAVYFTIVVLSYFLFLRKRKVNFTLWLYLFEVPVLLIAMYDAIHYEANRTTFIFMVFLLLFPMFILDQVWRILLFVVIMAALYGVLAYYVEPPEVYSLDMIHLVNVVLLELGSSAFFATLRMRMIKYADHVAVLADEDPLTGLYNRAGAEHHVNPGAPGIFVYIDLDKFKGVNDHFGHAQGDRILQETAQALQANFRRNDVLIRLGGDEFAVFSPGAWSYEDVQNKMTALLGSIRGMEMADDSEVMTASIGCAYAPHGCRSLEELTQMADQAMYEAKKAGKNGFRIVTIA